MNHTNSYYNHIQINPNGLPLVEPNIQVIPISSYGGYMNQPNPFNQPPNHYQSNNSYPVPNTHGIPGVPPLIPPTIIHRSPMHTSPQLSQTMIYPINQPMMQSIQSVPMQQSFQISPVIQPLQSVVQPIQTKTVRVVTTSNTNNPPIITKTITQPYRSKKKKRDCIIV